MIERFEIHIEDGVLEDLKSRLACTRIVPDFANENWEYGTNAAALEKLLAYWGSEFDWRAQEQKINEFSHFRTRIDDVPIHFIHERGNGPNPMPLIMTHGWPWTFWDLQKVIRPLADPAAYGGDPADAFHVIVPSLPGFGFSTPLTVPDINFVRTADIWRSLMRDFLGYQKFAAQGGDFGAYVTAHSAINSPPICSASTSI